MKKFIGGVKDSVTGLEIVFSEINYNEACFFIDSHFHVLDVSRADRFNRTAIKTDSRVFVYDENRSLLLGDWIKKARDFPLLFLFFDSTKFYKT